MNRRLLLLLSLLLLLTLSACTLSETFGGQKAEDACRQDLVKTLEEIKNSTLNEQSYVYSSGRFTTDDAAGFNAEASKKISGLVTYTVSDISINENTAQASVTFVAPDVYRQLTEIAAGMQENDTDLLLETLMTRLDENSETTEYDVTITLKLVDDHWYLVPSGELANAFSGGLIEQYSTMGLRVIESLLEEDNND